MSAHINEKNFLSECANLDHYERTLVFIGRSTFTKHKCPIFLASIMFDSSFWSMFRVLST